jgi:hypothetical protein
MSRLTSMSPDALRAVFSPEADTDIYTLLTIYDPATNQPSVRLCDGYTIRLSETADEVVYGVKKRVGGVNYDYIFLPLQITLPQEDEAQAPRCTITLNDVTQYVTPIIRSLSAPPKVTLELVLSKNLTSATPTVDTVVEVSFSNFYITNFTYNANTVTADLSMVDYEREPFPMHSFTPKYFPGLF